MSSMTDLTERLQAWGDTDAEYGFHGRAQDLHLAAATLETLTQEIARLREAGWRDIESAPKDGTIILLTAFEDYGEIFEIHAMRWAHIQRNGLFPGTVGMWTHPSGAYTWNDDSEGGGPTHWKHVESSDEKA